MLEGKLILYKYIKEQNINDSKRHTMRFKTYLNEGRTKPIDKDKTVDLILNNCKKHFKSIYMSGKAMPLYRGLEGYLDYGYVNTNKGDLRTSANTQNYMTLLMDNLPSWKKFPKRSRGMICSTDSQYADDYGHINQVIPYDNAKIAVASDDDIWNSFRNFIVDQGDVNDFNQYLAIAFKRNGMPNPVTWSDLKSSLIDLNSIYDFKSDSQGGDAKELFKKGLFDPEKNIMKFLDKELSPSKNNTKLGINNLNPNREVWIQGESIIVNENKMDDIIEGVLNDI